MAHSLLRKPGLARRTLVFYFGLSCLWAPFITVGLVPLLISGAVLNKGRLVERAKAYLSSANVCAAVLLFLMFLYYLSRFSDLPFLGNPDTGFGFGDVQGIGAIPYLLRLLMFYALEVGIWVWLVWRIRPFEDRRTKTLFWIAASFLFVLPLFRYGAMNDLVMRASIPCLFLVTVFVARAVLHGSADRTKKLILLGLLAVAASNPVAEVYRHLREMHRHGRFPTIPKEEEVQTLWFQNCVSRDIAVRYHDEVLPRRFRNDTFFLQYIGHPDAIFFRWMARPLEDVEEVPHETPRELP
jgi:hypothetical protein